jgi:hypothetical protein
MRIFFAIQFSILLLNSFGQVSFDSSLKNLRSMVYVQGTGDKPFLLGDMLNEGKPDEKPLQPTI